MDTHFQLLTNTAESMAEVVADIDAAFASDPAIDELGVLMTAAPPNLVLIEHKLGLSYEILKPLFSYTLTEFYALSREAKRADKNIFNSVIADKLLRLTRAALLVKGDMPMLYNLRKTVLLENHSTSSVGAELAFLGVLFTKHPKSPSSWHHRRWCLKELYSCRQRESGKAFPDFETQIELSAIDLDTELNICTKMSESYPKNYYSWMHRLWLLQFLNISGLESELIFTRTWLLSHMSDHSAANHRQQVIIKLNSLISDFFCDHQKDLLASRQSEIFEKFISNVSGKVRLEKTSLLERADICALQNASSSFHEVGITMENENLHNITEKIFCQYLFLEHVFRESKEIVVLRPGSETLWCHMRATADLLLASVPRILNEKRTKMKISEFASGNIFQPSDSVQSFSLNDFLIILNYSGTQDNEQSAEEIDVEEKKSEDLSSDDSFQYLNLLMDKLNSKPIDNEEVNFLLLYWLIDWLKKENNFCQNCIDNFCAWNHKMHIRMSLRYYCYVLTRILVLYDAKTFYVPTNIDDENSEENIVRKKMKKNEDASSETEKKFSFSDFFLSFIAIVRETLVAVSKQIQTEGATLLCITFHF